MKVMTLILRLMAFLAGIFESIHTRLQYRWRRLASTVTVARCALPGTHVYLGRGTRIKGHRHIYLNGRFVAMENNRIEVIESHGRLHFTPKLILGDNVTMECDCHIGCINEVRIGSRVLMGSRVYISDHSHGSTTEADIQTPPNERPIRSKGPVIIEDDVWLGEGVAVMPGVKIGHSSIIGANAVVTKDIPPFSLAVGVPARVIKNMGPISINAKKDYSLAHLKNTQQQ